MKKIAIIFFLLLGMNFTLAEPLRASASYDEPLKGFFGTWHVTSKMESTNNYLLFSRTSVDIWNLSGQGNVLILENGLTGAISSIKVDNADNLDGKKLKFVRVKEFSDEKFNYKHVESPEFVLEGKIFKGYDTYRVEKYDFSGKQISVDVVKYKVIGQKIAGE